MTPFATIAPSSPLSASTSGAIAGDVEIKSGSCSEWRQDAGSPSRPALAAAALLEQAINVIHAVPDAAYCGPSARIVGGTIGKHFRHCLDHFAAALTGIGEAPGAVIDYDHRARNVPMETCRTTAAAECHALQARILQTGCRDLARPVQIRVMLTSSGDETTLPSTFGRELAFAAHHAVHHHAMIKSMAEEFGFATPPEFGKAPSTLNFEKDRSCRASY